MTVVSASSDLPNLPELSRTEARAYSVLAQRASSIPFDMGVPWSLSISPLINADPLEVASLVSGWSFHFKWAGGNFEFLLPEVSAEQCLESLLGGAQLPDLSGEFSRAVVEAALSRVFQQLQSFGSGAPRVEKVKRIEGEPLSQLVHMFRVHLQARSGSQAISALLYSDTVGLLHLSALVARCSVELSTDGSNVPIKLFSELGYTKIKVSALSALTVGDVVLLDVFHVNNDNTLFLSANGRSGIYARVSSGSDEDLESDPQVPDLLEGSSVPIITILSSWTTIMSPPSEEYDAQDPDYEDDDDDDESDSESAVSLDLVPVRLSFDLGKLTFTLDQVRQMQPGQTIALGRPLLGSVHIRANGALIGSGDLIKVDGQIGVSVRHLFSANQQKQD